MIKWESIGTTSQSSFVTIYRMPTPEGWLVCRKIHNNIDNITYVPDPEHKWLEGENV